MSAQAEVWLEVAAFAGVFLGILTAFEGVRQALTRAESRGEARNRRMRMIAQGKTSEQRIRLLRGAADAGFLARLPVAAPFCTMVRQAGLPVSPTVVLPACIGATVLVGAFAAVILPAPAAAALALSIGIVTPMVVLRSRQLKRMDALARQLPDALDLMARGLRVGHPLNATIASVASDMADPVAAEFGLMVDQIAYGADLVTAFTDFAERIGTEDVRYLSVAVAIQHGTGGDLARILATLAQVIRDRMSMRRKIKAISAEGRLTSVFLSCLPVFIVVSTSVSAPGYYTDVMDDPLFRPIATVVLCLIAANFFAMRRLVNFRF